MDLRLSSRVRFGERYAVEFQGEAFDILNRQNVTIVNNTGYVLGSTTADNVTKAVNATLNCNPSFGRVSNANSNFAFSPRQIQIAVRFLF